MSRGRILCTPTGVSKADITADGLLVLDESGKVLSGKGRPFSELSLHLAFFHARPDVEVVLHSHAPTATGFGVAGRELGRPPLPEAIVSLGADVPTVPAALPGNDAVQALAPYVDDHDALLLAGNGVLTVGADVEQAYLRMELVEHLCRIVLVAEQAGGVKGVPDAFVAPLLAARTKAGLGAGARGRVEPGVVERVKAQRAPDLERVVREEITRVLRGRD